MSLLLQGAGSPGLPPVVLPAFVARYSAANLSAGALASWADISGNGGPALVNATGTKQPIVTAAYLNSLPSVLFDGVDDFLQAASFSRARPFTWFMVCKATAPYVTGLTFPMSGVNASVYMDRSSDTLMGVAAGTGESFVTTTTLAAHVYTLEFPASGSNTIRVDGGTASSPSGNATTQNALTIGADVNGARPCPVAIAEVAIAGSITPTERATYEAFLKSVWGTP